MRTRHGREAVSQLHAFLLVFTESDHNPLFHSRVRRCPTPRASINTDNVQTSASVKEAFRQADGIKCIRLRRVLREAGG